MNIWIKCLITVWLYLSIGVGVVLLGQIVVHKIEKVGNYEEIAIEIKMDPDDEDFGVQFVCIVLFWPIIFVVVILLLFGTSFRNIVKKIWEDPDEDNRR